MMNKSKISTLEDGQGAMIFSDKKLAVIRRGDRIFMGGPEVGVKSIDFNSYQAGQPNAPADFCNSHCTGAEALEVINQFQSTTDWFSTMNKERANQV